MQLSKEIFTHLVIWWKFWGAGFTGNGWGSSGRERPKISFTKSVAVEYLQQISFHKKSCDSKSLAKPGLNNLWNNDRITF